MAYNLRGRRVAYDNVAAGSRTGPENVITGVSWVSLVSQNTNPLDSKGFNNVAIGSSGGIEDTENAGADKLTSDHEDISDAG